MANFSLLLVIGLAAAGTVHGLQCYECDQSRVYSPTGGDYLTKLAEKITGGHRHCGESPGKLDNSIVECSACGTMHLWFQVNVAAENGGVMDVYQVKRGCLPTAYNVGIEPESDTWCDNGAIGQFSDIANLLADISDLTLTIQPSSVCFCKGDHLCNDKGWGKSVMPLSVSSCQRCLWATGPRSEQLSADLNHHKFTEKCARSDASEMVVDVQYCGASQVCASAYVYLTEYKGHSDLDTQVWIRGCIERGDYYSSAKSSCAGAHGRTAEIGRLLKTESFAHMGGAVCLCDETDCNGQTRGELSNMANEMAVQCVECRHVAISGGTNKQRRQMTHKFGAENEACASEPESLPADKTCSKCFTTKLQTTMNSQSGVLHTVDIVQRGCMPSSRHGAENCVYRPVLQYMLNHFGWLHGELEYLNLEQIPPPEDTSVCDVTSVTTTTAPPMRCLTCTWASGGDTQDTVRSMMVGATNDCIADMQSVTSVTCEQGEICGTAILDVNNYGGLQGKLILWGRGCVSRAVPGCHAAADHRQQTKEPFGVVTIEKVKGDVCFCDDNDDCNTIITI